MWCAIKKTTQTSNKLLNARSHFLLALLNAANEYESILRLKSTCKFVVDFFPLVKHGCYKIFKHSRCFPRLRDALAILGDDAPVRLLAMCDTFLIRLFHSVEIVFRLFSVLRLRLVTWEKHQYSGTINLCGISMKFKKCRFLFFVDTKFARKKPKSMRTKEKYSQL